MKTGAIEAVRDSLLIAALSAMGLVCFQTVRQSENAPARTEPGLDLRAIRGVVVHDSRCPVAEGDPPPFHFLIGNGVMYGDGEIVTTDAWRHGRISPGLRDAELARHTVSVGLIRTGADGPTAAQRDALRRIVRFLESDCGAADPKIFRHDRIELDGCAIVRR